MLDMTVRYSRYPPTLRRDLVESRVPASTINHIASALENDTYRYLDSRQETKRKPTFHHVKSPTPPKPILSVPSTDPTQDRQYVDLYTMTTIRRPRNYIVQPQFTPLTRRVIPEPLSLENINRLPPPPPTPVERPRRRNITPNRVSFIVDEPIVPASTPPSVTSYDLATQLFPPEEQSTPTEVLSQRRQNTPTDILSRHNDTPISNLAESIIDPLVRIVEEGIDLVAQASPLPGITDPISNAMNAMLDGVTDVAETVLETTEHAVRTVPRIVANLITGENVFDKYSIIIWNTGWMQFTYKYDTYAAELVIDNPTPAPFGTTPINYVDFQTGAGDFPRDLVNAFNAARDNIEALSSNNISIGNGYLIFQDAYVLELKKGSYQPIIDKDYEVLSDSTSLISISSSVERMLAAFETPMQNLLTSLSIPDASFMGEALPEVSGEDEEAQREYERRMAEEARLDREREERLRIMNERAAQIREARRLEEEQRLRDLASRTIESTRITPALPPRTELEESRPPVLETESEDTENVFDFFYGEEEQENRPAATEPAATSVREEEEQLV
jgi:hypothetical protein